MNFTHKQIAEANKKYYNQVADDYFKNEYYAYTKSIVSDIKENLTYCQKLCDSSNNFLDLGCGSGFLSSLIKKENLFKNIMGIDISEKQIELYNQKFSKFPEIKGICADFLSEDFDNSRFDLIACYSVLHHILDYKKIIKKVSHILKPKGIFYFDFEPNQRFQKKLRIPIRIKRKLLDKAPEKLDELESLAEFHHNHKPGINKEELIEFLKKDFDIIKVGKRFPDNSFKIPLMFLSRISDTFVPYFYMIVQKKEEKDER